MEDPFGKSQERPKVFPAFAGRAKASAGRRKSLVALPNVGGTKDLRKGFTFKLLLWHNCGGFDYCLVAVLGFLAGYQGH